MSITAILAIVNQLIGMAFSIYRMVQQIAGDVPIPSWEDLIDKNTLLQDRIDKAMKEE